jgi:Flp pilus assembly protein TadG
MGSRRHQVDFVCDSEAAVTIEFALISVLILAVLSVGLDFGSYIYNYAVLTSTVEQAAMIAQKQGQTNAINTSALTTYITGTANLATTGPQAATVTITCNGAASACAISPSNRTYACLGSNPTTYSAVATQGFTCPDGSNAGYYVTVTAYYPYLSTIVPDAWLNGANIVQSVTVRVQ